MSRALRILCSADFHVGRSSSRLGTALDARRFSCASALGDLVDYAIDHQVDVCALAGDLVDQSNKYYEAFGPLERALRRLADAGIDIFAIAGNHDFDVLPRLADALGPQRFHLLGRNGKWESVICRRDGAAPLEVVGWSFPGEHVLENPLRDFPLVQAPNHPVLGLLHADLDQPQSKYAPVMLHDLQARPVSLWLLGHTHAPRYLAARSGGAVLYPGSLQAMDPGETGVHGPWLVEIDAQGRLQSHQAALSHVRYESIDIDLSDAHSMEGFEALVPTRLRQELSQRCRDAGPLEICSCRLRLSGTTRLHGQLQDAAARLRQDLQLSIDSFVARIDKIDLETRPAVDLEKLARGHDVPADLAKLLLDLQRVTAGAADSSPDEPTNQALLQQVQDLCQEISAAKAYQPLNQGPPDRRACAQMLLRQGLGLLDALLAQKEGL